MQRALELDLPGVGAYAEETRVYPLGGLAAQVIGFAGIDNDGIAGIEASHESEMAGRPGSAVVVRDPAGRTLKTLRQVEPTPGETVRLTLDSDIQYAAEKVLERTVRDCGATAAVAIVLDPRTGEILAMANVPRVEDHRFGVDARFERNRAVTDAFEPGSIFKAVTIAGALADGLVEPGTEFNLPSSIQVADRVVHESHERGTTTYSVREILIHSSNVGAVKIGLKMGQRRLLKWVDKFGFGQTTGSEFPGESAGIVPREWSGSHHRQTCRWARASPSPRCRWPPRSACSPTAAYGCNRSSRRRSARRRPRSRSGGGSCRPRSRGRCSRC